MGRVVKYTRPINYLGLPTLTLPVPRNGGLPNGIQIIGKPYARPCSSPSAKPISARSPPRSPARSSEPAAPTLHGSIVILAVARTAAPHFASRRRAGPSGRTRDQAGTDSPRHALGGGGSGSTHRRNRPRGLSSTGQSGRVHGARS